MSKDTIGDKPQEATQPAKLTVKFQDQEVTEEKKPEKGIMIINYHCIILVFTQIQLLHQ